MDRSDAEDYLNVIRNEFSLSTKERRFPRKSTCLSIYSRRVNGNENLETVLKRDFPWCLIWLDELNSLFNEYTQRKQKQNVLDYDDLLLYWYYMLQDPGLAKTIGGRLTISWSMNIRILTHFRPGSCWECGSKIKI